MQNELNNAERATAAQLEAINGRLKKGDGWIGYRFSTVEGEKIPSKFLYVAFYIKRNQKFHNTKTNDPEEAYRQLLELQGLKARGQVVMPSEAGRIRYEHMRERYVKNGTVKRVNEYKMKHLDKFFKGMKVTQIDSDTIREYTRRRTAHGIAGPTIRRELGILKTMVNEMVGDKKISVDQAPNFKKLLPRDSKPAGRYIEPYEMEEVLAALPGGKFRQASKGGPSSASNLVPFYKFLYSTGCRVGAAQKLTWGMAEEHEGVLFLNIPGELLKNEEPLLLALTGDILDPVANELRARKRELKKEFRDIDNDIIFDSTNFRHEWDKACAKAGVGTRNDKTRTRTGVRIHDCRASAAINLIASGVEEAIALRIGGWKTRAMLDRYVGAGAKNRNKLIEAMRKGGKYVNDLMRKAQDA